MSIYKRTKLYEDKLAYKRAQNHVHSLVKRKKKHFITNKLQDNIGKPKELWKTLKSLGFSQTDKT